MRSLVRLNKTNAIVRANDVRYKISFNNWLVVNTKWDIFIVKMGKNKGTKKRKLLQENPVAEDHAMDEEQPEQQVEQGGEQAEPPIDQTEARESDEEENEEEGAEDRGKMKVPELPPHVEHI